MAEIINISEPEKYNNLLFYDVYTERFFRSSVEEIRRVAKEILDSLNANDTYELYLYATETVSGYPCILVDFIEKIQH